MTKEPAKGPTAKPVSVEDPLAKLIDKLSDEIEPVDVPTSVEEESGDQAPVPSDSPDSPETTA